MVHAGKSLAVALTLLIFALAGCLGGSSAVTAPPYVGGRDGAGGQGGAPGGPGTALGSYSPGQPRPDSSSPAGGPGSPDATATTSTTDSTTTTTSQTSTDTTNSSTTSPTTQLTTTTTTTTTTDSSTSTTSSSTTTTPTSSTTQSTTTEPTTTTTTSSPPPNTAPSASLAANPQSGAPPLNVTFSLSASDAEGDALSWWFDAENDTQREASGVGDPTPNVGHTYLVPGNYTATLRVSDGTYVTWREVQISVAV